MAPLRLLPSLRRSLTTLHPLLPNTHSHPHPTPTPQPQSSISPTEHHHFSSLSSHWWSPSGPFALLHRMNPSRTQFLKERVVWDTDPSVGDGVGEVRFLSGKSVLDVGCGGGIFSESLARLGGTVLGIDMVQQNIDIAETHRGQDPALGNLEYRCATAESLVEQGKRFDVVCAMEVLEHVEDPRGFLKNLASLTKPGGHLILSTISRTPAAHLLTLTLAEQILSLVPKGTHTYTKFIKPSELDDYFINELGWGKKGGERWEMERRGVGYLPWKGTWELMPRGAPWGDG